MAEAATGPGIAIAIRRLTFLLGLPDRDLCEDDHRTAAVPARWPCGRHEITDTGDVTTCTHPGEWVRKPPAPGRCARRGCSGHIAAEIRAEHWLSLRTYQKGQSPWDSTTSATLMRDIPSVSPRPRRRPVSRDGS